MELLTIQIIFISFVGLVTFSFLAKESFDFIFSNTKK